MILSQLFENFLNMKTQYLKNFINLKDKNRQAYDSYLARINQSFQNLKANHTPNLAIKLQSELHAAKDHKNLKPKDKQHIYKYLVERNVKHFYFLNANNSVQLRLLKLTKTNLDDYQLKWTQVWQRLLEKYPQLPSVRLYNDLCDFLKIIRHLYVTDNAFKVVNYFIERHSLYADNLCGFISSFANITVKTPKEIVISYLQRLLELYHLNQVKASDLLIMYLNAVKNHQSIIPQHIHTELSKILLYSLATPSSEKKDSIQSKFSTHTANLLYKIIGSCNTYSINLLKQVLQLTKNFIRPFQDSKKPLRFLCILLIGLSKRVEMQQNTRQKLAKLKAKEQKRLKNELKQKQKQKQQQQSAQTVRVQQGKTPITKSEQKPEQQEESESEDQQQNDSEEDEQQTKVQKLMNIQLQIQDNPIQKANSIQTKIQKLQTLLNNQITEEIKLVFKEFIKQHLQDIFYVNSKKIVNRLLKQTFKFFPQFIPLSLDILEKAGNIPQINEQGLISNIKHIAKFLFSKQVVASPAFLQNILKTLNKVQQNRRITDVWQIIATFVQKIPLLDQKDMEKISEQSKQSFQKKFGQNHDTFYQNYSELVFESLKRLFSQSQHYDASTMSTVDQHILALISNSYPFFKKRVIREMQEQIIQNGNKFLITIFHSGVKPSKNFQESLRQMIDNRNIETEQNLNLDINVNLILSIDMNIQTIKTLVRKYSKKNSYKFLRQCLINLTNYNLNYQPISSGLDYLEKKPNITLTQQPTPDFAREKTMHVYNYAFQLLDQLHQELKQFDQKQLKSLKYQDLVLQIYNSKESTFKNMKVQKRKTINELLQILKIITQNLFHQFEQYNPKTNTIDHKPAPYTRQSFIYNPKFMNIVDTLVYNQIFLHDHNIMQSITDILENEVFFMYRHQIRLQKDILRKYTKKNSKEQLPGESNLSYTSNIFLTKARIAHFSLLLNKYKDAVSIQTILEPLKILLVAPGNQKSAFINKILVKKSQTLKEEAVILVSLLGHNINSRFYYEKILSLLGDFFTTGYIFDTEQIIAIINAYLPLIQSQNIKIKEHSLKSFDRFLKTMHKEVLIGPVEQKLRQYTKKQKNQLIWIITALIILKDGKRDTPLEEYLGHIRKYLKQLQSLFLSPIRIVRRLSIFAYSFCIKKLRQSVKVYQSQVCISQKYSKPKQITQLFETGYLREQHLNDSRIANKQVLKKQAPYTTYTVKSVIKSTLYDQIIKDCFAFLLDNPEVGRKVLKQFHTDMAASIEEVMSMVQGKKHDLSEIAIKNLEGCYVSNLLRNLHFDRYQLYFGERFFKYLFDRDASAYDFRFFKTTREDVQNMLVNLQGYDNQSLYFIYMVNILDAYERHGQKLSAQARGESEKFCIKVIAEIIYKGSGTVFKKLNMLLSKTEQKEKLSFIANYLESLIQNKQKVSRASQLLVSINEQKYSKYTKTAEFILTQKLEISHSFINTIISSLISLPEKYMITSKQAQHFGIIDLQSQLAKNHLQKLQSQQTYMLNTEIFNLFLRNTLKGYIQVINQPNEGDEALRIKNQLIKATYSISTNAIISYCQFYQTKQTVNSIINLLELVFRLFQCKLQLSVDFKQLDDSIRNLLSNKYDDIADFERILDCIMQQIPKLPVKRQADILKIITNRPGNFLFVSQKFYERFLAKIIQYEEQSMIYKEVLLCLTTILAYVPLTQAEVQLMAKNFNKGQSLLLYQAYLLSTQEIGSKLIEKVLAGSGRERRNIFCKQMLQLRGKRQYLDDQAKYQQWKQIKQYSNPYHYHV